MHTLIATGIGLALLLVFHLAFGRRPTACKHFISVWLMFCIAHLTYGVMIAGYGVTEELAIHAVIFGVPALAAVLLMRSIR